MFDFTTVLKENPNGVLATLGEGGLKTRVFHFLFAEGPKLFFCTNSEKDVYKQLTADPQASFCTHTADFALVVSVSGRAVFVDDPAFKARALENPRIKEIYKSADNPIFRVFYLDPDEVVTFNIADGSKSYCLGSPKNS